MSIWLGPRYSVVNGQYPKLYPTIVAQLNVIQGEFVVERNFRCFSNDKWVDTTCHKEETKQSKQELYEVVELSFESNSAKTTKE